MYSVDWFLNWVVKVINHILGGEGGLLAVLTAAAVLSITVWLVGGVDDDISD